MSDQPTTGPERIRCTDCGVEFDFKSLPPGTAACPNCNSDSLPCDVALDVTIKINWHELRILAIWAENYARQIKKQGTIYSIAQRIEDQARKEHMPPLTLARELGEIPGAKLFDKDGEVPL